MIESATESTLLDVHDVAAMFAVTPQTVWRWVQRGTLPVFIVGKVHRFDPVDVNKFKESHKKNGCKK